MFLGECLSQLCFLPPLAPPSPLSLFLFLPPSLSPFSLSHTHIVYAIRSTTTVYITMLHSTHIHVLFICACTPWNSLSCHGTVHYQDASPLHHNNISYTRTHTHTHTRQEKHCIDRLRKPYNTVLYFSTEEGHLCTCTYRTMQGICL